MIDLEERLAQWRRDMAEALGGSAETLEELEGHLRDEVNRQLLAGTPIETAFAVAVERLGSPAALAGEFARTAPVVPWFPVRLALWVLLIGTGWIGGLLMPHLGDSLGPLLVLHVLAVTVGYGITLLVGTLAACYLVSRLFGALEAGQLQSLLRATRHLTLAALILTAAGIVLGGFWAQERLGRFWGWDAKETATLVVLLWDAAILLVLNHRPIPDHATLVLGLAGNVVVTLAWFGPPLLGLGLHSYPLPRALPLALFVLTQFAVAGLGAVPAGILRGRTSTRTG